MHIESDIGPLSVQQLLDHMQRTPYQLAIQLEVAIQKLGLTTGETEIELLHDELKEMTKLLH